MRVLYVEDDPFDADLVRRALAGSHADTALDTVTSLQAARARLQPGAPYDLVLTDLNLPDGNGLELIAELRSLGLPMAVVALTSRGDEDIVLAALKAGADDYLPKTDELAQRLPQTLRAALQRFRADQARHARTLKILYAEHELVDLDLTRRHFARHAANLQLTGVLDASAALDLLPRHPGEAPRFDLLLLDYRLVGESGLDVLKVVRGERGLDLPVVMVTGQGSEDVAAQAMRLGATDYIVKREHYLQILPAVLENAHHRVMALREHAALQRSEERLALVLRGSSDAAWDVDVLRGECYLSPRLWQMLGHAEPPELPPEQQLGLLIDPAARAALVERFAQVLQGGDCTVDIELSLYHRAGHGVPVLARGFVSRDERGAAVRISGTCTDLSERKRAEAQIREMNASLERRVADRTSELQRANQELEAFAYSVSHDLRAPLRAVDALSALLALEEGAAMSPAGRDKLGLLRASAARMDRLIGDLLEFARTSRQTPKRIGVAMLPFVRHCLEEFRAEIDQRGITVDIGPLPDAHADPALLRQLLMNLLGNAVKYTRRQARPHILVSAAPHGQATVYCIRDNGTGFDMKHAGKLFQVFQRLHGEAEFEGSGVGLAIVERIVARHGGRVWAESVPGEGAAFHFTLEPAGPSS